MTLGLSVLPFQLPAQAQTAEKPNILVIMGDDVGYWNIRLLRTPMLNTRSIAPPTRAVSTQAVYMRDSALENRAHRRPEPKYFAIT